MSDCKFIRVWRSLVSRLNGVQEAAGSNPVTRTKNTESSYMVLCSFLFLKKACELHYRMDEQRFPTGLNPVAICIVLTLLLAEAEDLRKSFKKYEISVK